MKTAFATVFIVGAFNTNCLIPAAYADGFNIPNNALEKVDFYHHRRKAQIVDERMEVNDLRRPQQAPTMIYIPVSAMPQPGYQSVGAAGGPVGTTTPSTGIPIYSNSTPAYQAPPDYITTLPNAQFVPSNIPANGIRPRNQLMTGYSTNITGRVFAQRQPAAQARTTPGILPGNPVNTTNNPGAQPLMIYPNRFTQYTGAGSKSALAATRSVSAQLRPRGELLHAQ